jgi:hypothetical protein
MRNRPEKFLTEVEIEQNVLIPLPNVDRGKGDPRNVMAAKFVNKFIANGTFHIIKTRHFTYCTLNNVK